ncbi:MAG: hypothetical protein CM1200mP2_32170 [Planctomycetaceae bacterium]|nr:MAG: hypothetical protein CM1200mP2_32170 [Planctomycetaceae bacterium]
MILPASSYFEKTGTYTNTDRRVQLGRPVLDPPGDARQDWEILCEVSRRVGLESDYADVAAVFDEFTSLTRNYQGLHTRSSAPPGDSGRVRIRKTTTGPRFFLATVSQPTTAAVGSCPVRTSRPTSCPTTNTPSCSTPAACWNTGNRQHDAPQQGTGCDSTRGVCRDSPGRSEATRANDGQWLKIYQSTRIDRTGRPGRPGSPARRDLCSVPLP